MSAIEKLSENIFLAQIPGMDGAAAVIQFAPRDECQNVTDKISYRGGEKGIRNWGKSNDLPNRREYIIMTNNIVGPLMKTSRNILLGDGMYAYREVWRPGKDDKPGMIVKEEVQMPDVAKEFFDKVDIDSFNMENARNLLLHANMWPEFVREKGSDAIAMMKAHDSKFIRSQEQNKAGVIENYLFSGRWSKENTPEQEKWQIKLIPAYMRDREKKQARFMWHLGDPMFGDSYYYEPAYWGVREWIELANCIPYFHLANLRHGYTIRFHIKYREGYFKSDVPPGTSEEQIKKAQEKSKAEMEHTMQRINDVLSGLANTGRAIVSSFEFSQALNKEIPGLIIEPIKAELHDEALLKLFEKSNDASMAAQTIHPTLANIETQGRLSSGSEMRIAYNVYLAIHTPLYRKLLMKPINELVRIDNGWDKEIFYGFRDTKIVTLDEDKEGTKKAQTGSGANAAGA